MYFNQRHPFPDNLQQVTDTRRRPACYGSSCDFRVSGIPERVVVQEALLHHASRPSVGFIGE
jgi:hypothetical protein